MNTNELEFTVFCLEYVAEKLGIAGDEVYKLLTQESDLLDRYIIPSYDVLHTQGKDYIVDDIIFIMQKEGVI